MKLLDLMNAAYKAHNSCPTIEGDSGLYDHFDHETGEQKDSWCGSAERLIATVISNAYEPDDMRYTLDTIARDLRDMGREIMAVGDAISKIELPEEEK